MVCSPDRQTLLMVVAWTVSGMPAFDGGLARRDLALARLDHLAHQDGVDARGIDAGLVEHALDGDAAEVLGAQRGERARELADGGATSRRR